MGIDDLARRDSGLTPPPAPSGEGSLVSRRLGDVGFLSYLRDLLRLGAITERERLGWADLHAAVVRARGLHEAGEGKGEEWP